MFNLVLRQIGCIFGCFLLLLYRKELCMILSIMFVICLTWFSFKGYKMMNYIVSCMQPSGYSNIPSFIFEYPYNVKSCPQSNTPFTKKPIGNVAFDGLDTLAQCFQVQFK